MIDVEMLRPTADEMLSGLSADQAMKKRILLTTSAVDELPQIAGEMLAGMKAMPALRHRILVKSDRILKANTSAKKEKEPVVRRQGLARFTPVAGMALVMALMIGLGVNYAKVPVPAADSYGTEYTALLDLNSGMAGTAVQSGSVPQYRSLFVGEGANPPLIGVNGRYYRMLSVPVSSDVIGTAIAEVQDFTDEPALAATVGVVSNIVPSGTQVYAVNGLSSKTACIAEVDGVPRLFQRVGYASATILGNELFEDTLDVNGQVAALELSGVGIITDEQAANELIYMLNEFAVYGGSDVSESGQALTIYLTNGLSLQLTVNDDVLGGCGSWICPEFFDSFETALAREMGG